VAAFAPRADRSPPPKDRRPRQRRSGWTPVCADTAGAKARPAVFSRGGTRRWIPTPQSVPRETRVGGAGPRYDRARSVVPSPRRDARDVCTAETLAERERGRARSAMRPRRGRPWSAVTTTDASAAATVVQSVPEAEAAMRLEDHDVDDPTGLMKALVHL